MPDRPLPRKTRRTTILLLLIGGAVLQPAPGARAEGDVGDRPLMGRDTFTGRIEPGDRLVFRIWGANQAVAHSAWPERQRLTTAAEQAARRAPTWLQPRLRHRLGRYPSELQDRLAAIILQAQPTLIDEIAFSVATVPPEEVERAEFSPALLARNAELLLRATQLFSFVEPVNVGVPGDDPDFHSTLRYRLLDEAGEPYFYTLPREHYYWYVVHPRLSNEAPIFVDPRTGEPADPEAGGVFWRDYYLLEDVAPDARASLHFALEHPHRITAGDLSGWSVATTRVLDATAVDPIPLIVDPAGDPVLVVYSYPGQVNDGEILATTLPVEALYRNGRPALLENLVQAGNASARLPAGARVVIIKDRPPFGEATVEEAARAAGFQVDVIRSDELELVDLTPHLKAIVPSDQPRALYEALARDAGVIESFLSRDPESRDVVFEFHGATAADATDDGWTGLVLPGGLSAGPTARPGELQLLGYPTLVAAVSSADLVWDGQAQTLSGRSPLPDEAQAVLRLGYFGTQNTPDRCSEMPTYYHGPDGGDACPGSCQDLVQQLRSAHPQRTLYLHYGNCGEMQQVLGAAARSALLPVASLDAWADDHVWNELFLEDRWVGYTIYRSDSSIQIDPPGLFRDGWAAVARIRGDGWLENATSRYTPALTLAVTVTDAAGRPVDGATLTVATEYNKTVGGEIPLVPVMIAWTDHEGRANIALGTDRDYYLSVQSVLGSIPGPERNIVARVLCQEETSGCPGTQEAGITHGLDLAYETELPKAPAPTAVQPAAPVTDDVPVLSLAVRAEAEILADLNPLFGTTFEKWYGPGCLDIQVLDATGFARHEQGESFTALAETRSGQASGLAIALPPHLQETYVIVTNPRATRAQHVEAVVETLGPAVPAATTGPTPGCGCQTDLSPTRPFFGLLLAICWLVRRRRRSEDQIG